MSKQKKSGKRHSSKTLSDVTINDFANSTVCKNRLKKSNNVRNLVEKELEEKPWDEKTDDYEGEFVEIENEDGTVTHILRKPSSEPRRRKKTVSSSDETNNNTEGKEYPLDIWFLLSEYIRPEDVGRFAGISRGSFEVVNRASFWFSIYKRYYNSAPNLPERLQPENLLRKYSLRTSVIRALHYMYPPFILRVKSTPTLEEHPDVLLQRQCILMWYQEENKRWIYYFKMKADCSNLPPHYRRPNIQKPDLLEMLDDVSANPDDSCQVLQVTCCNFIAVPPVLGLTLTSVSMHLSQGFMHHRLQLGFGNNFQAKGKKSPTDGTGCTLIILDPVINVKILNWWHPLYPHGHSMELLMNQD